MEPALQTEGTIHRIPTQCALESLDSEGGVTNRTKDLDVTHIATGCQGKYLWNTAWKWSADGLFQTLRRITQNFTATSLPYCDCDLIHSKSFTPVCCFFRYVENVDREIAWHSCVNC
ncbi:hypothetical protein KC19_VG037900 [Ceratodon purpureus]|uniref:Uncharacterized protein n=1 Tax=Ceratodon purpureus TaxID=3225 RepID=A0A8T0HLN6_CERPU|nr:hypothetical protein KC19_VG037900 [Ceratodon purpureus]